MDSAGPIRTETLPGHLSALRRHFEISLYFLLLTGVLTLVSTGKLDLVSILLLPAALLFKGYRWWRGKGPEISNRVATWITIAYFIFFPIDLWVVSRILARDAQNPGLYAALLATIHLMLFAIIVRLYSASTTRDYLFLTMMAFASMLASAILTVDTVFLVFFFVFLALAVSTFVGLEMWRSAQGAVTPPIESGTQRGAAPAQRAGGDVRRHRVRIAGDRSRDFLPAPAIQRRLHVRIQSAAHVDFRLQRRCRTRRNRRNQEEQRWWSCASASMEASMRRAACTGAESR